MLKTPEEARGMWCPFARVPWIGAASVAGVNRDTDESDRGPRCIADQCMAWRWQESEPWAVGFNEAMARGEKLMAIKLHRAGTGAALQESKEYVERVELGKVPKPLEIERKSGFCGLAGRP